MSRALCGQGPGSVGAGIEVADLGGRAKELSWLEVCPVRRFWAGAWSAVS